jgi:hypothetical protein
LYWYKAPPVKTLADRAVTINFFIDMMLFVYVFDWLAGVTTLFFNTITVIDLYTTVATPYNRV